MACMACSCDMHGMFLRHAWHVHAVVCGVINAALDQTHGISLLLLVQDRLLSGVPL